MIIFPYPFQTPIPIMYADMKDSGRQMESWTKQSKDMFWTSFTIRSHTVNANQNVLLLNAA